MKKMIFLALTLIILGVASANAQVSIGPSETAPAGGALLDLKTDYLGGLVLPRVQLTAVNSFSGLTDAATANAANLEGLLVYHTGENGITEGVYLWTDGNWQPLWIKQ
jgi:hypothetical protein